MEELDKLLAIWIKDQLHHRTPISLMLVQENASRPAHNSKLSVVFQQFFSTNCTWSTWSFMIDARRFHGPVTVFLMHLSCFSMIRVTRHSKCWHYALSSWIYLFNVWEFSELSSLTSQWLTLSSCLLALSKEDSRCIMKTQSPKLVQVHQWRQHIWYGHHNPLYTLTAGTTYHHWFACEKKIWKIVFFPWISVKKPIFLHV